MQGERISVLTQNSSRARFRTAPRTFAGGVPAGIENMSLWTILGACRPLVAASFGLPAHFIDIQIPIVQGCFPILP